MLPRYLCFHVPVVPEPLAGHEAAVRDVRLQILHGGHAGGAGVKVVVAAHLGII